MGEGGKVQKEYEGDSCSIKLASFLLSELTMSIENGQGRRRREARHTRFSASPFSPCAAQNRSSLKAHISKPMRAIRKLSTTKIEI